MKDVDYMQRALELAVKGKGKTSPNPAVGALIVKHGKIIAESWHKKCGEDHAEIVAFKKAGKSASGATLYVTLEPCFHHGRTPPCVEAVIKSGIKKAVIGMKDPNPLTKGKSIAKLKRAGIETKVGFLEKELFDLNEPFIKYITKKMPYTVAKTAQTLDGKVAAVNGSSKWITSSKTRQFSRKKRNDFDAILVGIGTVLSDNPQLKAPSVKKLIKKVVLDSSLRLSHNARLLKGASAGSCIVATTNKACRRDIERLEKKGANVIVCPSQSGKVSLKWLFRKLAEMEISSILIEGGPRVIGRALNDNLVDKMHIYIAPKILGDKEAKSAVEGRRVTGMRQLLELSGLRMEKVGEDLFLEANVSKKKR